MIVCRIAMARAHSFRQFSLIFSVISLFSYVVKPTIVVIISHFSIFVKLREIPQENIKLPRKKTFRGSARNSATRGKLWALVLE